MRKIVFLTIAVILVVMLAGCARGDKIPPVISDVSVTEITPETAHITWTTDEPATVKLAFTDPNGKETLVSSIAGLATSHSRREFDLTPDTTYYIKVKSTDAAGNEAVSEIYTFTTATPVDMTPPVISHISVTGIIETSATITWITDKPSDSNVDYGMSTSYGITASNSVEELVTSHSIRLDGLNACTTYHYRVKSKDASDNEATSGDDTFTTIGVDLTLPVIDMDRETQLQEVQRILPAKEAFSAKYLGTPNISSIGIGKTQECNAEVIVIKVGLVESIPPWTLPPEDRLTESFMGFRVDYHVTGKIVFY
jgi:hypothetical protein